MEKTEKIKSPNIEQFRYINNIYLLTYKNDCFKNSKTYTDYCTKLNVTNWVDITNSLKKFSITA